MKYYFKEEMRLIYNEGEIFEEESGNLAYTFKNQKMMFPETHLYSYEGEDLGFIQMKMSWVNGKFELYHRGEYIDTIESKFHLLKHELLFRDMGWQITGNFLGMEFQILDEEGNVLADVDEEMWHLTKQYSITVHDERNAELLLLIVLAIYEYDRANEAAAAAA